MARAAACLALVAGCEVGVAEQQSAIVGGAIDTGDPAVVAIVARRTSCESDATAIPCSGTLIAPRVVLTAAHCIAPGAGQGALEVFVGSPVADPGGRFIVVEDAVRHPLFDDVTHAYDLGLLRLAEAAPVAPVALPAAMLDASHVGASARVVGYGVTAVGTIADGHRREGTMTVSAVASQTFEATPAPANTCGGDSGGPVLVTIGAGEQLLGVTSSGDTNCTVRAVNARVDVAIADFIQPFVDANPPGPGDPIPLDLLCTAPCATAADCPAAMACLPGEDGLGRCQIAAYPPGDFTTACATDAECGSGRCARVSPADCRCHAPCGNVPGKKPPDDDDGCAAGGGDGSWLVMLLIALGRRRSARRTPV